MEPVVDLTTLPHPDVPIGATPATPAPSPAVPPTPVKPKWVNEPPPCATASFTEITVSLLGAFAVGMTTAFAIAYFSRSRVTHG